VDVESNEGGIGLAIDGEVQSLVGVLVQYFELAPLQFTQRGHSDERLRDGRLFTLLVAAPGLQVSVLRVVLSQEEVAELELLEEGDSLPQVTGAESGVSLYQASHLFGLLLHQTHVNVKLLLKLLLETQFRTGQSHLQGLTLLILLNDSLLIGLALVY
jgi:hypothetical protein